MTAVWVSDADGALGRRVVARLVATGHVELVPVEACAVAVHLGGDPVTRSRRRERITANFVDVLGRMGTASRLVLVSSAMVYGAWPDNPVPLTEDAVLRPDAGFAYASQLAAVEQLADAWRCAAPGRAVAVLRPVVSMAERGTSLLANALAAGMGQRFGEDDSPAQFLHLDDLAAAIALAVTGELDGVYNVAPDGFVPAASVRALAGARPRLQLPDRLAEVVNRARWRFQRGPIPPGLGNYARWPWLVANDRLKAQGWQPTITNEQAYVEGTEAKWWTMVSPSRRQELALGGMVGLLVGAVVGTVRVIRSVRARRAPR